MNPRRFVLPIVSVIAVVALAAVLVLWSMNRDTRRRLDALDQQLAGLAVQAAILQNAAGAFSGPLADQLDAVIAQLDTFAGSTIEVPVDIDQEVPIRTDIALDRTVTVPIKTTIPIRETLDTTIKVRGPFGIDVPLDVSVPIDVDVPIDIEVPIPINETVPLDAVVPVQLTVPLSLAVEGTPLADLAVALRDALSALRDSF